MSQYYKLEHKEQNYCIPVLHVGGSAFTNQPANDAVEVVSNNAADTQKCTIWGTTHGTSHIVYETITLAGATPVKTTKTNWGTIYGVFLGDHQGKNSVAATGTITVREDSADQTITTIAATRRSAGTQIFQVDGANVTIHNITGNTWTNTKVYPTSNNSFLLTAGMIKDEKVKKYLFLLGDTTGSTAQIQVWRD